MQKSIKKKVRMLFCIPETNLKKSEKERKEESKRKKEK